MTQITTPCRGTQFAHSFTRPKGQLYRGKSWCRAQFGDEWSVVTNLDGVWAVFWAGISAADYYTWYFKNDEDATWFALNWT